MPGHDIIVMGASAGGVEALTRVVRELPGNLPAAVFAVLHMAPSVPSLLPAILGRCGALPAVQPRDGDTVEPGRVYCAVPDYHLMLKDGVIRLTRGPKENAHRPAVDVLFRSAAVEYGPRVVGVVLSGSLDDGTAGLIAIKRQGGVAVVQNPNEAIFSSMPLSAIENADVDHVLHLREIGATLTRLAREEVTKPAVEATGEMRAEVEIAALNPGEMLSTSRPGKPVPLACPECQGTLYELTDGQVTRYRCRVGHAFSMETMLTLQSEQVETALWNAVVALKEKAVGIRKMLEYARRRGHGLSAQRFEEHLHDAELQARQIEALLEARGNVGAAPPPRVQAMPPVVETGAMEDGERAAGGNGEAGGGRTGGAGGVNDETRNQNDESMPE